MHIFQTPSPKELQKIMQDIKVDGYGINIMVPKAINFLIRINAITSIAANILKQEMLSFGGDAAVSRDTLTGKARKTDCLLMGNLSQFNRLKEKLDKQPFGLNKLAKELGVGLSNYQEDSFLVKLGRYDLKLRPGRAGIMGVVNMTPDSFSGDGLYDGRGLSPKGTVPEEVVSFAEQMIKDGADIIDVGGESSRPQAKPVSVKEELRRVIPVIKILAKRIKVPVSVDTYKPEVAKQALDSGASLVNDISGLRSPLMAKIIAKHKAGVIIMHMKGTPRTMQNNPVYRSLIEGIISFLEDAINRAITAGVNKDRIIIDPGIGFAKTVDHNLEILKRLREFKILGYPILVGPSRKSFLGTILNAGPKERIFGTVSSCILAAKSAANILRVHDVREVAEALKVMDAISCGKL